MPRASEAQVAAAQDWAAWVTPGTQNAQSKNTFLQKCAEWIVLGTPQKSGSAPPDAEEYTRSTYVGEKTSGFLSGKEFVPFTPFEVEALWGEGNATGTMLTGNPYTPQCHGCLLPQPAPKKTQEGRL